MRPLLFLLAVFTVPAPALAQKQQCTMEQVRGGGGSNASQLKQKKQQACQQKKKTFIDDAQAKEKCTKKPTQTQACCCDDPAGGDDKKGDDKKGDDKGGGSPQGGGAPQGGDKDKPQPPTNPDPPAQYPGNQKPESNLKKDDVENMGVGEGEKPSNQVGFVNAEPGARSTGVAGSHPADPSRVLGAGRSETPVGFKADTTKGPTPAGAEGGGGGGGGMGSSGGATLKKDDKDPATKGSDNPYESSGGKLGGPRGGGGGGGSDSAVDAAAVNSFKKDFDKGGPAALSAEDAKAGIAPAGGDDNTVFKMVNNRYRELKKKGLL